jgi:BMFP domain-containing protein YqiC
LEGVVESVERSSKQGLRDSSQETKEIRQSVDATVRSVTQEMNKLERESEQNMRSIRREVDDKIKKALDNPLAN